MIIDFNSSSKCRRQKKTRKDNETEKKYIKKSYNFETNDCHEINLVKRSKPDLLKTHYYCISTSKKSCK
jgi:hypothetical protein